MANSLELTSEKLKQGEPYSCGILAHFFQLPELNDTNTEVFRPNPERYKSLWLFVSQGNACESAQFKNQLSDDYLRWQSQSKQEANKLIDNHSSSNGS